MLNVYDNDNDDYGTLGSKVMMIIMLVTLICSNMMLTMMIERIWMKNKAAPHQTDSIDIGWLPSVIQPCNYHHDEHDHDQDHDLDPDHGDDGDDQHQK